MFFGSTKNMETHRSSSQQQSKPALPKFEAAPEKAPKRWDWML